MKFLNSALLNSILVRGENQPEISPMNLHPLVLAYVGDAYFNLFVRTRLLEYEQRKVGALHNLGAKIVSATMQALALRELESELTAAEADIIRRGRNTKSTVPKSATLADYRYSSGFEALIGSLFLTGKQECLQAICDKAFTIISREMTSSLNKAKN